MESAPVLCDRGSSWTARPTDGVDTQGFGATGHETLSTTKPIVVGRCYRAAGAFLARPPHFKGSDGLWQCMSKELRMENGEVVDAEKFGKCPVCGHTLTVAGTCDNCEDEEDDAE